jgi:hypothetical protein
VKVYHGTDAEFSKFDDAALASNPNGGLASKVGHWFSDDPEWAKNHGANVKEVSISLKNPKVYEPEAWGKLISAKADFTALRKTLQEQGYDGIYIKEKLTPSANNKLTFRSPAQWAVFDSKAIKSSPSIPKELPKTDKLGRPLNHALAAEPKLAPLVKEADHFGYTVNFIDKKPSGFYGKHFQPEYRIDLYTKGRTPEEIASTLEHEIGHVADYQRRGIEADPTGDSIRGFDGKMRPMADHDIFFRNDARKAEGEAIRAQFTRGDHAANTQKEIYADAFRLYKQNPKKLEDIAPRIYKDISEWYEANKAKGGTPKGGTTKKP